MHKGVFLSFAVSRLIQSRTKAEEWGKIKSKFGYKVMINQEILHVLIWIKSKDTLTFMGFILD